MASTGYLQKTTCQGLNHVFVVTSQLRGATQLLAFLWPSGCSSAGDTWPPARHRPAASSVLVSWTVGTEGKAESIHTPAVGLNTTGMSPGMACAVLRRTAEHPTFWEARYRQQR